MRASLLAWAAVLAAGCAPQDAPDEIDGLSHYLFRLWAASEPEPMQDGVAQLERQLSMVDVDGSLDGRSFRVSHMKRDDLEGINWPMDRDPDDTIGSCVARRSKWPIEDNARFITEADQLDAEPTASVYMRHFVDPADPSCFPGQACPALFTDNDITRDNAVLSVSYTLHKNLRWTQLDATRWAVAARSFTDRGWPGQKDGTGIWQSYSIDVFLGQADGRTIRMQCSWSENSVGFAVDDGLALSILVDGVNRGLVATDDAIGKRYHGE